MTLQILIAMAIIGLLAAGLYYRRRNNEAWRKEARYDERGEWIDRRGGSERGTYGTLDREREAERSSIYQQGLIRLLAECIVQHTADRTLRDALPVAGQIMQYTQAILGSQKVEAAPDHQVTDAVLLAKKDVLDFLYREKPELLSLEISTLQDLDKYVQAALVRYF
jgi:hypothetical protein